MAIKAGRQAVLKIAGTPNAFVDELMETTDNIHYTIVDSFKSIWHYDSPVTIFVNGQAVQKGVRIYRAEGVVVFEQPQAPDAIVTVDGKYVTTSKLMHVNSMSFEVTRESYDITGFTDKHRRTKVGTRTGSGSFTSYDVTNATLLKQLDSDYMFIEMFTDYETEEGRTCAWVVVNSHTLNASVSDMQSREVSFETTGNFFY